jgi:hypothetical protein
LWAPTNVTIGGSVTNIGGWAFSYCTSLTNVTIPNSVTSIGDEAFERCTSVTSITIGTNVTSFGREAFCGCRSRTSITIPNSVTNIGAYAFASTCLTSITIPNGVTSIGDGAFGGCTLLTAITVDTKNPAFSSVGGVLFNQSQTLLAAYPGGIAGGYTIPSSVTSIGNDAFSGCTSLTSITIPNSVFSIGDWAFSYCSSLTSITIGNSVTSIGGAAFAFCMNLTRVTIPDSVTALKSADYYSSRIGSFSLCTSLTNVTIGDSVTSIGDAAFSGCTNLTGVYFKGSAPGLGRYVFGDPNSWPGQDPVTVYYLPGTTGWGTTFGGRPTALWFLPNPLILDNSFGVQANGFSFTISWATNVPVVVEACTDPANHTWQAVSTNILTGGWSYFSDPQWTNYPARFYRLRSP